jgi:hypothetical protein
MSFNLKKAAVTFLFLIAIVEAGIIADFHLKLKSQGVLLQSLMDLSISNNAAELVNLIDIDCSRPFTGSEPDYLKLLIKNKRELAEQYIQDSSLPQKSRERLQNALSHSCKCCKGT